uniref:EF-hand domain-containing protein n=1 Tax=Xiphophorus couchianus TaxID=32473 RepID=A0A3B5L5U1_9TELE
GFFSQVAGQDGQISADELQRCLTQSGMSGSYQPFSMESCRLMINMLDRDMSGTMGFAEFKDLCQALNGWKATFSSFDRDHSGTVEGHELQQAITTMGYNLSPQAMNCIMKRYSNHGKIPFDEFVSCCVRLRALTGESSWYENRNPNNTVSTFPKNTTMRRYKICTAEKWVHVYLCSF